jgi:hypothetical protein
MCRATLSLQAECKHVLQGTLKGSAAKTLPTCVSSMCVHAIVEVSQGATMFILVNQLVLVLGMLIVRFTVLTAVLRAMQMVSD